MTPPIDYPRSENTPASQLPFSPSVRYGETSLRKTWRFPAISKFVLLAFGAMTPNFVSAQMYQRGYEGSVLPSSDDPQWTISGSASVANGMLNMPPGLAMSNPVYADNTPAWNALSAGPGSTVEFKMKIQQAGSGTGYSSAFLCGTDQDRFTLGITSGTTGGSLELRGYSGTTANIGPIPSFDASKYNTYRIIIAGRTAKVFLNQDSRPILSLNGSGGPVNGLMLGRFTALVRSDASSSWDYVRWTNQAAALPLFGFEADASPKLSDPQWTLHGSDGIKMGLFSGGGASTPMYTSGQKGWNATASGPGSTIEFGMRVSVSGTGTAPYSANCSFGSDTDRFRLGVICYSTGGALELKGSTAVGVATGTLPWFKPNEFNVYRITLTGRIARVYLNHHPDPLLTLTGDGSPLNDIMFGGSTITGAVRADAVSQWDYVRWNNGMAQPPLIINDAFGERTTNLSVGGQTTGSAFNYSVLGGGSGVGVELQPGQTYTLNPAISGPCAVYVSAVTPSLALQSVWGGTTVAILENKRFYRGSSELTPQKSTIQSALLFNADPTRNGSQKVSQEIFVGSGNFANGALTITLPSGASAPVKLTSYRVQKLTLSSAQLAGYQNNSTFNKRVVYNNDGYSFGFGDPAWQPSQLLDQINCFQGSDAQSLDWCAVASGVVSFSGTNADMFGRDQLGNPLPDSDFERDYDRIAAANYAKLAFGYQSSPPRPLYPTLVTRGDQITLPVWGSLRMAAYYGDYPFGKVFNGSLWRQHPEYYVLQKSGVPNSSKNMSLAFDAVKNQRLGVLSDMVTQGCVGVNLDFCRHPDVVGYDQPLLAGFMTETGLDARILDDRDPRWVDFKCRWINQFMQSVRTRMNTLGASLNRQIKISVRIPAYDYRSYGFDPATWISQGWIDRVIPAYPGFDTWYDPAPWSQLVEGTSVEFYPSVEALLFQTSPTELTDEEIDSGVVSGVNVAYTREDYLRRTAELYGSGAQGIYLFNLFAPHAVAITLNRLGDKEFVRRWSKFEDRQKLPSTIITIP